MLAQVLVSNSGPVSIKDLSALTGIKVDDIIYTLQSLQLVQYYKGQHVLCAAPAVIEWYAVACRLQYDCSWQGFAMPAMDMLGYTDSTSWALSTLAADQSCEAWV